MENVTNDEDEGAAPQHVFLTGPELLALRGSAKLVARIAQDRLTHAKRLQMELDEAYWAAVELDKAARALASHGGQQ